MSPIEPDRRFAIARAAGDGVYDSSAIACSTRSLVDAATPVRSLSTRDTVWCETPARRATSNMVGTPAGSPTWGVPRGTAVPPVPTVASSARCGCGGAPDAWADSCGPPEASVALMRPRSEPLREAVVGLVPAHFALEVREGGVLVDDEELGLRHLREVAEHVDADRGRHDRV